MRSGAEPRISKAVAPVAVRPACKESDGTAREAPTWEELVRFATQLPTEEAVALLLRARVASKSSNTELVASDLDR